MPTDELDRVECDESGPGCIEHGESFDELFPFVLLELQAHRGLLIDANTVQTLRGQGKQLHRIALQLDGGVLGLPVLPLEGDRAEEEVVSQPALHLAVHSEVEDPGKRSARHLPLDHDLAGFAEQLQTTLSVDFAADGDARGGLESHPALSVLDTSPQHKACTGSGRPTILPPITIEPLEASSRTVDWPSIYKHGRVQRDGGRYGDLETSHLALDGDVALGGPDVDD